MTDTQPGFNWTYEQTQAFLKKSQRTIQLYVKDGKLDTVIDPKTRQKLFNEEQVKALAKDEGVVGKPKGHAITVQQLGQVKAALVFAQGEIQQLRTERDVLLTTKDTLLKEQGDLKEERGRLETENKHLEKAKTLLEKDLGRVKVELADTTKRFSRTKMGFLAVVVVIIVVVGGFIVLRSWASSM